MWKIYGKFIRKYVIEKLYANIVFSYLKYQLFGKNKGTF